MTIRGFHDDERTDPERGVPYSVSWFDQGGMLRADRVYLLDTREDPAGFQLIDALTGKVLTIWREATPLFRRPTSPSVHRRQLASEWDRPVSPVRVHSFRSPR